MEKYNFHAMHVAGWQRGPEGNMGMETLAPSKNISLGAPDVMEQLLSAEVIAGKAELILMRHTQTDWYGKSAKYTEAAVHVIAQDMAFLVK